jgi:hypothetical protein
MFEQFWSFQTFWMLFVGIQASLWLRMESGYSKARIAAQKRRDRTKEVQGISVIVAAKKQLFKLELKPPNMTFALLPTPIVFHPPVGLRATRRTTTAILRWEL